MNSNIFFLLKVVRYSFLLLVPFNVYCQTMQLQFEPDYKNVIVQNQKGNILKVVPSSRMNYPYEPDRENTSDSKFKASSFNWELKFSLTGKVFKDVSFANPLVGYIVTELGAVYKTTNGGENWAGVMNLGFPYYWYGVDALTADTVVISGFNNQGNIHSGVVRWSFDGGSTWTNDIVLTVPSGVGWLSHIHFFDSNRGIVSAEFSGGMHYTNSGGKDTASWTYVQINSDLGWFAGNVDTDTSGNIFTTGIHLAHSSDYGINWTSGPPADAVFDGGVDFLDNLLIGMTGGGQISTPVSGWVHRTINGGQSWSQRLYNFPYPIRAVKLFDDTLGLAFGGNLYQEAGGIYVTTDGGSTWSLDINTSAEMFSYDVVMRSSDSIDVWCVGSTGGSTGFIGKLYKSSMGTVVGTDDIQSLNPPYFQLHQNYPNPFNPGTKISWELPEGSWQTLKVYDLLGNEIVTLVDEYKPAGSYEVEFDGTGLSSGTYFYQLIAGSFIQTGKMVLLR